ncbi:hypothetical protein DY000_02014500 [Brassica cretica]|uniref:Uncharacterized protein n=1 Tax=Brassica cretica TaxID=69181 RepID=A0ABQ7D663_BRACR|nr:hypothetical protein DY000_02014500 [Brassica cretica]
MMGTHVLALTTAFTPLVNSSVGQVTLAPTTGHAAQTAAQVAQTAARVKLFYIRKYGRFSLSEVFHFPEEGGDPGTGPGKLHSGEPGFLLAGILGTGVTSSGDPEAGVLPGGITCALKSSGVAHSQQASLRQDIAPVVLRSWLWASDDVLEMVEPGALMFSEEELVQKRALVQDLLRLCLSSFPSYFLLFRCRHLELSSSEAGEGSDCDLMAPLPLSCVYAAPPLVGPASSVGEGELAEWRSRYSLPSSLVLRIPTLEERASSYIPGEIAVYEAFFDSSLRGTIPGLIAAGTHPAPSEGEKAVLRA